MLDALDREPWTFPQDSEWLAQVRAEARTNQEAVEAMMQEESTPIGYYRALRCIAEAMPHDMVFVAEGASTMDISRSVVNNYLPRTRLDAGSFGSMGLGHGFAIGAATQNPGKHILCLQGDGAFGFAGTECEVAVRYNLPITWVVFNNGGIGGHKAELFERFLHTGRTSMPDVDIDIASSRRDQVLAWVEQRWGLTGTGETY